MTVTETVTETQAANETVSATAAATAAKRPPRAFRGGFHAFEIPVGRVEPDPDHPRTESDPEALERLAGSLATHGQIQPITVRHGAVMGRYVIVTGERRWRAAVMAGLPTVAAVVIDGGRTQSRRLELQVVENAVREDLSPIDQARAYLALMDRNAWSARQLAGVLNLHHGTVARALSLLDLPGPVRDHVGAGRLAPSVAAEIARVGDPARQAELADRVVAEGLSRSQAVRVVRGGEAPACPPPAPAPDAEAEAGAGPWVRRVIETSAGRVTVEIRGGGGDDAVFRAFVEASRVLQGEILARHAEEARADAARSPAPTRIAEPTVPAAPVQPARTGPARPIVAAREEGADRGSTPSPPADAGTTPTGPAGVRSSPGGRSGAAVFTGVSPPWPPLPPLP